MSGAYHVKVYGLLQRMCSKIDCAKWCQ